MKLEKLQHIPTLEDIERTHEAIQHMIHRTPVLTSESMDQISGARLFFKCENFQKIGAFKMRGAASASIRLTEEEKKRGLATHSSGNHAQAVAKSAKILGIPAYIVMPENAPSIKKAATKGYGATITFCEPTLEARETTLQKIIDKTGATFIHPYDNYNVIAGQATAAKELVEEGGNDFDILMAPVGGGGVCCGTALIAHYLLPNGIAIGAEPRMVDDAYRSFKKQKLEFNTSIGTIADGLRTNLSEKTLSIILQYLEDIIRVDEDEIIAAMRLLWERMKILVEPSSAVPLAAVLKEKDRFRGKKVGIILTGGNVDLGKLPF